MLKGLQIDTNRRAEGERTSAVTVGFRMVREVEDEAGDVTNSQVPPPTPPMGPPPGLPKRPEVEEECCLGSREMQRRSSLEHPPAILVRRSGR